MKKLVFLLMSAAVFGFLSSCDMNDDDYSETNIWVGFGLIHEDSVAQTYTIVMDDGEILFPENLSSIADDYKNNDRVLTNFTILGAKENANQEEQYNVEILSIRKILYKGILDITPEIEDSIGNDPIKVRNKWIKNDMLNFELEYRGGNKTHFINLVKQPGEINADNGPVLLELRHNTNGDSDQIPLAAMVTFDMSSLKIPGKTSTLFKVSAQGFNGHDFEFIGEYKY
jgi:hypothetical protein